MPPSIPQLVLEDTGRKRNILQKGRGHTSAHRNSHSFKTPIERSTCLEVLLKVGELVSKLPDSRSGPAYPCSTKRAFAFVPTFPSSTHLRTKRALRTRPSEAFSGSSSSCHTPFLKIDRSSAFFALMKARRSSTVMRDSFKSASCRCPSSSSSPSELQPSKLQRVSCP